MIIAGNNSYHNLKGNTNLKFTIEDFGDIQQPIIHLTVEKTKIGGEKYKDYFFEIHGPINRVIEVKNPESYSTLKLIWESEMDRYTNGRKKLWR